MKPASVAVRLLLALGCAAGLARAASVSVNVTPEAIHLGESAQLSVTFTDATQSGLQFPRLPQVKGLRFRYQGQSSSMQFVNGQSSVSVAFNYLVVPEKEGEYTVPSFFVTAGGERLRTKPVKLTVLARSQTPTPTQGQPQWAYLMLEPQKKEVFVGERLPVEINLYIIDGQDYAPQPLNSPGFVFNGMEAAGQQQTRLHGAVYHVLRHVQNAFPTKEGELQLGPAEADVTLRIRRTRRRTGSPFDDFFNYDPFGLAADLRPVHLKSEPATIRVKPLPTAGRPADFTGAVGRYRMDVSAAPTNVAVGEPVHLKIRITGQGLVDNVTVPVGEGWDGFKIYPPRTQTDLTDNLRALGTKTIEQDVVPERVDVTALPALRFSFFDPEAGRYRTLSHPAQPLLVRPAAQEHALAPLPRTGETDGGDQPAGPAELVPLKERLGPLAFIRPPLLTRPWFAGVLLAPALLCGAAWGWRRRLDHLARNPLLARRLAFGRVRRRLLTELRQLATAGDATAFFAHVFRVLQEQLGERLDLPAAAITEAVIEERLVPAGAPEALRQELHELFRICNQARYAPVAESGDLPGFARRVEAALDEVRRLEI